MLFFFFKQKTAYEMRISDWSSDVCSSDLCIWIALTSSSIWTLALCALVVVFVYSTNLGPAASATQSVAPTNMRTIAAGCTQVMLGFLGMGLGPFLPGVLSDALEPIYGTDRKSTRLNSSH